MQDVKIEKVVVNQLPSGCWECSLFYCDDDHTCGCRPKMSSGCLLLDVDLDDPRYEHERHANCLLMLDTPSDNEMTASEVLL